MTGDAVEAVAAARRWPRRTAYGIAGGLAVLLPTSTAGASLFVASQILNAAAPRRYPVLVRASSGGRVTLTRTVDTARPIPLGFTWPTGHAQLGPVITKDRATVVREVTAVTRGTLQTNIRGYTHSYLFDGDPKSARGLDYEDVSVPGDLGGMPAWLVPPTTTACSDVWIVAVHGRGAPRGEALRVLPTLAASGHPTLVITYRNDEGAPASPDRRFHLGDTEWRDVTAAVRYARSQGATGVVLYGWSMGGAMILNALRRSQHDGFVRSVVLDCPVVDWTETLWLNTRQLAVPPAWTWTALRLIERRLGVPLRSLDQRPFARQLDVPALVFVDHDDPTVAPVPTVEFALANPDKVTLVESHGAGHCRSWNLDAPRYERAVWEFLAATADTRRGY